MPFKYSFNDADALFFSIDEQNDSGNNPNSHPSTSSSSGTNATNATSLGSNNDNNNINDYYTSPSYPVKTENIDQFFGPSDNQVKLENIDMFATSNSNNYNNGISNNNNNNLMPNDINDWFDPNGEQSDELISPDSINSNMTQVKPENDESELNIIDDQLDNFTPSSLSTTDDDLIVSNNQNLMNNSSNSNNTTYVNSMPVLSKANTANIRKVVSPRISKTNSNPSTISSSISKQAVTKKDRSSHNVIEKKYRNNINDKILALRDAVPSLRAAAENSAISIDDLEGLAPASKLNKANILYKATEYIKHLEIKNQQLFNEVMALRSRFEYPVGGPPPMQHNPMGMPVPNGNMGPQGMPMNSSIPVGPQMNVPPMMQHPHQNSMSSGPMQQQAQQQQQQPQQPPVHQQRQPSQPPQQQQPSMLHHQQQQQVQSYMNQGMEVPNQYPQSNYYTYDGFNNGMSMGNDNANDSGNLSSPLMNSDNNNNNNNNNTTNEYGSRVFGGNGNSNVQMGNNNNNNRNNGSISLGNKILVGGLTAMVGSQMFDGDHSDFRGLSVLPIDKIFPILFKKEVVPFFKLIKFLFFFVGIISIVQPIFAKMHISKKSKTESGSHNKVQINNYEILKEFTNLVVNKYGFGLGYQLTNDDSIQSVNDNFDNWLINRLNYQDQYNSTSATLKSLIVLFFNSLIHINQNTNIKTLKGKDNSIEINKLIKFNFQSIIVIKLIILRLPKFVKKSFGLDRLLDKLMLNLYKLKIDSNLNSSSKKLKKLNKESKLILMFINNDLNFLESKELFSRLNDFLRFNNSLMLNQNKQLLNSSNYFVLFDFIENSIQSDITLINLIVIIRTIQILKDQMITYLNFMVKKNNRKLNSEAKSDVQELEHVEAENDEENDNENDHQKDLIKSINEKLSQLSNILNSVDDGSDNKNKSFEKLIKIKLILQNMINPSDAVHLNELFDRYINDVLQIVDYYDDPTSSNKQSTNVDLSADDYKIKRIINFKKTYNIVNSNPVSVSNNEKIQLISNLIIHYYSTDQYNKSRRLIKHFKVNQNGTSLINYDSNCFISLLCFISIYNAVSTIYEYDYSGSKIAATTDEELEVDTELIEENKSILEDLIAFLRLYIGSNVNELPENDNVLSASLPTYSSTQDQNQDYSASSAILKSVLPMAKSKSKSEPSKAESKKSLNISGDQNDYSSSALGPDKINMIKRGSDSSQDSATTIVNPEDDVNENGDDKETKKSKKDKTKGTKSKKDKLKKSKTKDMELDNDTVGLNATHSCNEDTLNDTSFIGDFNQFFFSSKSLKSFQVYDYDLFKLIGFELKSKISDSLVDLGKSLTGYD